MKVYYEHHALRSWMRDLEKMGRITLVLFPYDQNNRHIKEIATPLDATWDKVNVPPDELDFNWEEFSPSSHYSIICKIIGEKNIKDVKHVDSAFKSKCLCMFTCDKHILLKSKKLKELSNITFLDPDKNKEEFITFLNRYDCEKKA